MTDNESEYAVLVCPKCSHEYVSFCERSRHYNCILCDAVMERSEPLTWALNFSVKHELSMEADHELAERMRQP